MIVMWVLVLVLVITVKIVMVNSVFSEGLKPSAQKGEPNADYQHA